MPQKCLGDSGFLHFQLPVWDFLSLAAHKVYSVPLFKSLFSVTSLSLPEYHYTGLLSLNTLYPELTNGRLSASCTAYDI